MLTKTRQILLEGMLHLKRGLLRVRGFFVAIFARVPQRIGPRVESRRTHAGIIADLFASIMCRVDGLGAEDMDTAMDILRYDFPNVEPTVSVFLWMSHCVWLPQTARWQNATRSRWKFSPSCTEPAEISPTPNSSRM